MSKTIGASIETIYENGGYPMSNKSLLLENVGSRVSFNGEIREAKLYADESDEKNLWTSEVAYEVIRVINGVPIFFEDHIERLNASLVKLGAGTEFGVNDLLPLVSSLLAANGAGDCNIKIQAASNGSGGTNILLNINKSFYPPPEYYADGVPVGLYAYTREDPNVKKVVGSFKEQVKALMESGGVFELLLYDSTRRLTEGSRSNLFFSRGEQLFTAPDRIILKGIIRKYAFIAAERAGIEIVERPVTLEEIGLSPGSLGRRRAHGGALSGRSALEAQEPEPPKIKLKKNKKMLMFPTAVFEQKLPELTVNGAFLTGTSIGVLPIARIGGVALKSAEAPVIKRIRAEYEKIAREYINSRT